jgi:phosphatidylglycerol:prolipoprotein diacylglycerol transferase
LCWLITWLVRNKKPFKGFLFGFYFILYGICRFVVEYFREPDEGLGSRIEFVKSALPPAIRHPRRSFSTGQILSALMILAAAVWLIIGSRLPNREPIRLYPASPAAAKAVSAEEKEAARKKRRKLRKKLR